MSSYLQPILHNNELNRTFNASDFNYQFNYINYKIGDSRYVLTSLYDENNTLIENEFDLIDASLNLISVK